MARIKLTVIGLYNYDPDLFSGLQIPEGLDRDNLISEILEQAGDLGLLYPDGTFMRHMIGVWSSNEQEIWDKLYASTQFEYDPIENYDRTDTINRTVSSTSSSQSSGQSVNSQTAFNSDAFKDTDKRVDSDSSSGTAGGTEAITTRSRGNIGVTTSQQMIEQEREVVQFNMYHYITRSFIDRFCIELY